MFMNQIISPVQVWISEFILTHWKYIKLCRFSSKHIGIINIYSRNTTFLFPRQSNSLTVHSKYIQTTLFFLINKVFNFICQRKQYKRVLDQVWTWTPKIYKISRSFVHAYISTIQGICNLILGLYNESITADKQRCIMLQYMVWQETFFFFLIDKDLIC